MKALVIVTDQPNKNGRVYPRAVMEAAIAKLERSLPVYRSYEDQMAVQCEEAAREIIGTGTITQSGSNVFAEVSFNSAAIQHQVMLHGLTVRTGGVGDLESNGTVVTSDFYFTGLFLTHDPA